MLPGLAAGRLDVDMDGATRLVSIAFPRTADGEHWQRLCAVANALQNELGLPAPAVSTSGLDGFALWLSLESPAAQEQVQQFLSLLRQAYFPDMQECTAPAALPPCLHPETGKWSAFIHPGMGASFAEESGLEMAPPASGQVALLAGLESASVAQFAAALALLERGQAPARAAPAPPARLLLRDATLEDIVRHLHAMNIEPTFRHLHVKR
ncbi:MAG: hypothetical protein V4463_13240 [Pseudomonadota bacterium]